MSFFLFRVGKRERRGSDSDRRGGVCEGGAGGGRLSILSGTEITPPWGSPRERHGGVDKKERVGKPH